MQTQAGLLPATGRTASLQRRSSSSRQTHERRWGGAVRPVASNAVRQAAVFIGTGASASVGVMMSALPASDGPPMTRCVAPRTSSDTVAR